MNITVIIPVYNEANSIAKVVESIIKQTFQPSMIILGDNDSTDGTAKIADDTLKNSGIPYKIIRIKRYPSLQKLNINNVLHAMDMLIRRGVGKGEPSLLAVIEADVVLEEEYFEKVTGSIIDHGLDRTCMAAGKLQPLGFPEDPFPLPVNLNLWGGNRVYVYKCWRRLNDLVDIRLIPLWDTDHVVLAYLLGYDVLRVGEALSYSLRGINVFRGFPKGFADGLHRMPLWWILYKVFQHMDIDYLKGYITSILYDQGKGYGNSTIFNAIRSTYRWAAHRALLRKLGFSG